MQFQKTEWYIFFMAAFVVALIYSGAFKALAGAIFGGINSLLGKVMGQDASGNFQKPF